VGLKPELARRVPRAFNAARGSARRDSGAEPTQPLLAPHLVRSFCGDVPGGQTFIVLPLLLACLAGCPAHQSGSFKEGASSEEDEEETAPRSRKRHKETDRDRETDRERETETKTTETADGEGVRLKHEVLREAVQEESLDGRPRRNVEKLREALCEGQQSEPKVFYHIVVSSHWHYYWICSDPRPHKASSTSGAKNLRGWLEGFQRQARIMARDCPPGSGRHLLKGTHESGILINGFCDGRIVLSYPDGDERTVRFADGSPAGEASGAPVPSPVRRPPPAPDPGGRACPPCGACPSTRCRSAAHCPACPACPPPRACPAPPPCPACDCSKPALAAGQKGFRQGVEKACKRICDMLYKKCRSIDPNTALCYQVSEYCAAECPK
jgi:hypothetical protein